MGQFSTSRHPRQGYRSQGSGTSESCSEEPLFLWICDALTENLSKLDARRRRNTISPSTFVPTSEERILYLLSYCELVRLRLHSVQI